MRVANPGCYPTGFILAVRPLIEAGVLNPAARLTVNAVSGYSGGGKALIEEYKSLPSPERGNDTARPLAIYGLDSRHKHLSEMQLFSCLEHPPLFVPAVLPAYCGMMVSTPVPISAFTIGTTPKEVFDIWNDHYADSPMVEHPRLARPQPVARRSISGSGRDLRSKLDSTAGVRGRRDRPGAFCQARQSRQGSGWKRRSMSEPHVGICGNRRTLRLNPELVDSHCHLDQLPDPPAVVREAQARAVSRIVAVSESADSMRAVLGLKQNLGATILAALGMHPAWITQHSEAEIEAGLEYLSAHPSRSGRSR